MTRRAGSIRPRSSGSFELRYSLGTDAATGKRREAAVTFRGTRKDADEELRRLLKAIDDGTHVDPSRLTVREWLDTWLKSIREEVSPKTHERYSEIVNHFLAPALGKRLAGAAQEPAAYPPPRSSPYPRDPTPSRWGASEDCARAIRSLYGEHDT